MNTLETKPWTERVFRSFVGQHPLCACLHDVTTHDQISEAFPSVFAYCKRSKTGGGNGLGTSLLWPYSQLWGSTVGDVLICENLHCAQLPKSRSKSHVNLDMYEQKEKQVHHLEEVNMSLKQTNDDLNEELAELRRQLGDAQQKVCVREGVGREGRWEGGMEGGRKDRLD